MTGQRSEMIRHIESARRDSMLDRVISWLLVAALGVMLGLSLLGHP